MKVMKKALGSKKVVTIVWLIGLIIVWEIGATVIAQTKRSPENVLPHLYQIFQSVISSKFVTSS